MNTLSEFDSRARRRTAWAQFVGGSLLIAVLVLVLMQGYAPPGPVGEVFRNNLRNGIDATPLFYTDVETPLPDK